MVGGWLVCGWFVSGLVIFTLPVFQFVQVDIIYVLVGLPIVSILASLKAM